MTRTARHRELFTYLFKSLFTGGIQKQPKLIISNKNNILIYTNNKLNIVVKLIYLQIKHSQSIFPRFLILVLNSKTELLDVTLAGRLFHIKEPLK